MTKKGENIYKRKDNRWEGRYLKGHNEYGKRQIGYVYGKSYREVKEKLTEAKEHLEALPEEIRALPFSCICAQWLRQQHNTVKQSTYAKYVRLLDTHILTAFGTLPLSDFSPELIHQFLLEKLEAGRRDGCGSLSPKTVQDIYMILKAVIRYGELKYKTQLPKPQPYPFPKQEHTILVLSLNEQMRLEHSMRLEPYNLRKLGILLCLYSGLRIGEICALRWTDIDLNHGILHVSKTLQRIQNPVKNSTQRTVIIESPPKTISSIRDIPLTNNILSILSPFESLHNQNVYFLTGLSDHYIEPRNYQYFFRRCLELLDIPPVNFHCLRHTFATRCIEVGFDVKTLSEILGHSNVSITLNHYVHSSIEMKRRQMELLFSCHPLQKDCTASENRLS